MKIMSKKKIKEIAETLVGRISDEVPYQQKEYFTGWPEDVIGKSATKELNKEFFKALKKYAVDELKKRS